jgi:hypothetical protein
MNIQKDASDYAEETIDTDAWADQFIENHTSIDRSLYTRAFLHKAGLQESQINLVQAYLSSVLKNQLRRSLNINLINTEEQQKFIMVPPHYKFIDAYGNMIPTAGTYMDFPYADPMTGLSTLWMTWPYSINSPFHRIVLVPILITGAAPDSARIGRRINYHRIQIRLVPCRYEPPHALRTGAHSEANRTLAHFGPCHIRILLFYSTQVINHPRDFLKMQLNTEPQTCGTGLGYIDDYFINSSNYIYAPINRDAGIVLLIDKVITLPSMNEAFGTTNNPSDYGRPDGMSPAVNLEYEKYSTNDLQALEYDIDLEGLISVYATDSTGPSLAIETGNTFQGGGAQTEHIRGGGPIRGHINMFMFSSTSTPIWCFRGYARTFFTDF